MVDPAGSFLILSQVNCDGLGSFLFACPCGIQDQCRVCINGYAAEGFSRLRCASLLGMDNGVETQHNKFGQLGRNHSFECRTSHSGFDCRAFTLH
jgi:hypothetical protein